MRILVLGGTVFLSEATAAEAVARGHEVVCAARGESGPAPDGARLVTWDRREEPPAELTGTSYDAVVDVARHPSRVRRAVAAFPDAHWVFVSTINVYEDESTPGGRPGTLALRAPLHEDADLAVDPEAYGPMKVACEQAVREGARTAMVVRPGLISGPGDPTGRFTYWPARLADGGEVLAPGAPHDSVQVVDVRDLATWIVDAVEAGTTGDYDGIGPVVALADLLAEVASGVGSSPVWTWVDQDFLTARGVEPWAGPDSVPLWLPRPAYDGLLAHDVTPSLAAGLRPRPVAETAAATLAWLRETPDAVVAGITREREAELLAAWREAHRS
ncbi:NAD-dependent epimerase/dehydratase family protein [Nocardioides sp. 503]|uniref:NAD-dependent epimerase/dehydratase family protein n=1 Tax=Nocardioides sp. 503 TaxID=2508326 RepID=UPI00106FC191|nr:NAD-dependent epimerase/dehydratase family protein [Nocardioides sp. 503]